MRCLSTEELSSFAGDRYSHLALLSFAAQLLGSAGIVRDRADTIAERILDADLFGHFTHGLTLLPMYLVALADGTMRGEGDYAVLNECGSMQLWDGNYLPGQWLVPRAIDCAMERAALHGMAVIVIRKSYHIGCLASYLQQGPPGAT